MNYGKNPLFYPERVFFIADVHNESEKLKDVLGQILPQLQPNDHIVFGGDLINRGPDVVGVFNQITYLWRQYPGQIHIIRGNHEEMLIAYALDVSMIRRMMPSYGKETLSQLQKAWNLPDLQPSTLLAALIQEGVWEWLQQSLPYYETPKLIASHAPLAFDTFCLKDGEDEPEGVLDRLEGELKWDFSSEDDDRLSQFIDKFRVCGHQFSGPGSKAPRVFKSRAYVDTGCGCIKDRRLHVLEFPAKKIYKSHK